jgi:sarcosine oxidase
MSEGYDAVVVGLGAMGGAAAFHLARRGRRVLGLDRFTPPHDKGSSHGKTRLIRQAYFEDPAYVPLVLRAYELWEELGRTSGQTLLHVTGGLWMGRPESALVAGSLESARQWALPHEVLGSEEIRHRFPVFTPDPDVIGLYEERAGVIPPEAAVAAHLQAAVALGAELRFGEPVTRWEKTDDGVAVTTATGVERAAALVLCPGPWAADLLGGLGVPFAVERQVQCWFEPNGGVDRFLPNRHPVWGWEAPDGRMVYGFPAFDGPHGGVKVGLHHGGAICTPQTIDRHVSDAEVEDLVSYLKRAAPALPGRFLRAVTCMYTNTPDRHFVIAIHPDHPQVAVAAGFSGHGFKYAPVVGEILADLALDGSTRHPVALFDPRRFASA